MLRAKGDNGYAVTRRGRVLGICAQRREGAKKKQGMQVSPPEAGFYISSIGGAIRTAAAGLGLRKGCGM